MTKHRNIISFDKNLLNQLKDSASSCVEVQKSVQHLALHPSQLENINDSVKNTLNKGIAKYNKELEGLLLGYQNIKLFNDTGAINFDTCFIHIDIQADFYLFKPNVGKELSGVVNKFSADHVGVLVYNAFNVSLPRPVDKEDWLGDKAQIGNEVLFKITYVDLELRLPYIRGEIISITENDSGISTGDENTSVNHKKKNKKKKFTDDEAISPILNKSNLSVIEDTPKLKHKKRSHSLSEDFAEEENNSIKPTDEVDAPKSNKRKRTSNSVSVELDASLETNEKMKSKRRKRSKSTSEEVTNCKDEFVDNKEADLSLDKLRQSIVMEETSLIENESEKIKRKKKKSSKSTSEEVSHKVIKQEKVEDDMDNSMLEKLRQSIMMEETSFIGNNTEKCKSTKKKRSKSLSDKEIKQEALDNEEVDSSLDKLRQSIMMEENTLIENSNIKKEKKKSKKEKKQKKEKLKKDDDEVSLPDLNLNELFSSDFRWSDNKVDMADSQDKQKKPKLTSSVAKINLPEDSELEQSLTDGKKKRKKESESPSPTKKKRKHTES